MTNVCAFPKIWVLQLNAWKTNCHASNSDVRQINICSLLCLFQKVFCKIQISSANKNTIREWMEKYRPNWPRCHIAKGVNNDRKINMLEQLLEFAISKFTKSSKVLNNLAVEQIGLRTESCLMRNCSLTDYLIKPHNVFLLFA